MIPDTDQFYKMSGYSISYQDMYLFGFGLAGLGVYALGQLEGRVVAWMYPSVKDEKVLKSCVYKSKVISQSLNEINIVDKPDPIIHSVNTIKPQVTLKIPRRLSPVKDVVLFNFGKHKQIYRLENSPFVLKVTGNYNPNLFQNEHIAYIVSQKLSLNVVPFVSYVDKGKVKNPEIIEEHPKLKKALVPFNSKFVIIQNYIKKASQDNLKIDVLKAHEVLFFNLIIGRSDLKAENSIIDKEAHIWEIDNDLIGEPLTPVFLDLHWLKTNMEVWKTPVSEDLIHLIKNLDTKKIADEINLECNEELTHDVLINQIINNLVTIKNVLNGLAKNNCKITIENILEYL